MTEQEEAERRHCEEVARGIAEQHNWHRDSAATKALAQTIARERADARRRALAEVEAVAVREIDKLRGTRDPYSERRITFERFVRAIRALASPKP